MNLNFLILIFLASTVTASTKTFVSSPDEEHETNEIKVDPKFNVDPDPDPELLKQHLLRYKKLTKITRQRIEKNTVKSSIICPEINKKEFTTDPPWNVLGLPECLAGKDGKDALEARLYMTADKDDYCLLDMEYLPNKGTLDCLTKMKERIPIINKVVIIIHGFLSHYSREWLYDMMEGIQRVEKTTAVIILGWGKEPNMKEILHYHQAAANTRYVSAGLMELMRTIHNEMEKAYFPYNFINYLPWMSHKPKLYTHCIGHSLGAHICGQTGKIMNEQYQPRSPGYTGPEMVPKWDRISGMDPAGPLFFNDLPKPYSGLNCPSGARLNVSDADLVDVIHTDGDARYITNNKYSQIQDPIQFGTLTRIGTADFYPGTGYGAYGCFQPGCFEIGDVGACSHSKSHEYYMASITKAICFASRTCNDGSDPHQFPRQCEVPLKRYGPETIVMGYFWAKSNTKPGEYTVEVVQEDPFCTGVRTSEKLAEERDLASEKLEKDQKGPNELKEEDNSKPKSRQKGEL